MEWLGEEINHLSLEGRQKAKKAKCNIAIVANQWGGRSASRRCDGACTA
jgi:hypothetical protein